MPPPKLTADAERMLITLHGGRTILLMGGKLAADISGRFFGLATDAVDELERLGLLDLAGERPQLTERGRYWGRWHEQRAFKRRAT